MILDQEGTWAKKVLKKECPSLLNFILTKSLNELEDDCEPLLEEWKKDSGPAWIIPERYNGKGKSLKSIVHFTTAVSYFSPSLAIAMTMHNFSVASLVQLADNSSGNEWIMLEAISHGNYLVCSAFAESVPGQVVTKPAVTAVRAGSGWKINGIKKPCTIASNCDVITASVWLEDMKQYGIAMFPSTLEGVSTEPFWTNPHLRGARSDALVLRNVQIDNEAVYLPQSSLGKDSTLDRYGSLWFNMLLQAAYLGMSIRALTEATSGRQLRGGKAADAGEAVCLINGHFIRLLSDSERIEREAFSSSGFEETVYGRKTLEDATRSISSIIRTVGGGYSYITRPESDYLLGCLTALPFHPPSTRSLAEGIYGVYSGDGKIEIV